MSFQFSVFTFPKGAPDVTGALSGCLRGVFGVLFVSRKARKERKENRDNIDRPHSCAGGNPESTANLACVFYAATELTELTEGTERA